MPKPERPDASSSLSSTVAWHACARSGGSRHGDHLVEAKPLAAGAAAVVELRHRSGKKGGQHEYLHEITAVELGEDDANVDRNEALGGQGGTFIPGRETPY